MRKGVLTLRRVHFYYLANTITISVNKFANVDFRSTEQID